MSLDEHLLIVFQIERLRELKQRRLCKFLICLKG